MMTPLETMALVAVNITILGSSRSRAFTRRVYFSAELPVENNCFEASENVENTSKQGKNYRIQSV